MLTFLIVSHFEQFQQPCCKLNRSIKQTILQFLPRLAKYFQASIPCELCETVAQALDDLLSENSTEVSA